MQSFTGLARLWDKRTTLENNDIKADSQSDTDIDTFISKSPTRKDSVKLSFSKVG